MTAYRVYPKRLAGLNRAFRGDILVGNFSFVSEKARLGALYGNRFSIIIRVGATEEPPGSEESGPGGDARRALAAWSEAGCSFVNYFGLQRFGAVASAGTHAIGCALVRQQWADAVELVMRPREGESGAAAAARDVFAHSGDAKVALTRMPRFMATELALLDVLAHFQSSSTEGAAAESGHRRVHSSAACAASCAAMPAPARALFVNSYQSVLWNKVASLRAERYGLGAPVVGDLVFADASSAAAAEEAETLALSHEDSEGAGMGQRERDAAGAAAAPADGSSVLPAVRVLTPSDIATGRFSILDVVLPLPGFAVEFPEHSCGAAVIADLMQSDGFTLSVDGTAGPAAAVRAAWASGPRAFTAPGGYRKLIGVAEDVRWCLVRHARVDDDLQVCCGLVCCVACDVLLKSIRLAQVSDADMLPKATTGPPSSGASRAEASGCAVTPDAEYPRLSAAASCGGPHLAVQISFSLRSSSYATMALREVMKQSTERGQDGGRQEPAGGTTAERAKAIAAATGAGGSESGMLEP